MLYPDVLVLSLVGFSQGTTFFFEGSSVSSEVHGKLSHGKANCRNEL